MNRKKTRSGARSTVSDILVAKGGPVISIASDEIRDRRRAAANREKAIGCRIRDLRKARGTSREAFAAQCGLCPNQMTLLEDGHLYVTIVTLKTIVDALNISLGDFFEGIV